MYILNNRINGAMMDVKIIQLMEISPKQLNGKLLQIARCADLFA